jgi:hypothetical protein
MQGLTVNVTDMGELVISRILTGGAVDNQGTRSTFAD